LGSRAAEFGGPDRRWRGSRPVEGGVPASEGAESSAFHATNQRWSSKVGPLATDGSRVYFNEVLPGSRTIIAQVSIHGGEAVPIALQIRQPMVLDASQDGTELLIGNEEGNSFSLWVQADGGGISRASGHGPGPRCRIRARRCERDLRSKKDVYSTNRAGSSSRKLLTAGHAAFAFPIFARRASLPIQHLQSPSR